MGTASLLNPSQVGQVNCHVLYCFESYGLFQYRDIGILSVGCDKNNRDDFWKGFSSVPGAQYAHL